MNIFDIIGPVMVGPSSSHTAGAVKIGYVSRKLMGEAIKKAEILLYGSFLATGKGHGTDCALVAGLLNMMPEDERIPRSFEIAEEEHMDFSIGEAILKDGHPNSVVLKLEGISGKKMEIVGESLGGSLINIASIDGKEADFSGENPTLIIYNEDQPGLVTAVTGLLSNEGVNIASMKLHRSSRGGNATMIMECDEEVNLELVEKIRKIKGVTGILYYSAKNTENEV